MTPISEQWANAAKAWVDAEAAASLLEETKSAVLSQMMMQSTEKTVAAKEMSVKAGDAWRDHVEKMVTARRAANLAKVKKEFLWLKFSEWQSKEANHRAEMKL